MNPELLSTFIDLPIGWNYGEGVPCTQEVLDKAIEIYKLTPKNCECEVFPMINGGIMLAFYKDDIYLEIEINNDMSMTSTVEKGNIDIEVFEPLTDVKQKFSEIFNC